MFFSDYDGLKNYYTTCDYVLSAKGTSTHQLGMNYPYGESILYTDNTPAISYVIKHFTNADDCGTVIRYYNLALLILLFLTHWALFGLGKTIGVQRWLNVIMALTVPWILPNLMKLSGHFNLTVSLFMILTIWIMILLNRFLDQREYQRVWVLAVAMIGLQLISFFTHIYWVAINMVMIAVIFLVLIWSSKPKKRLIRSVLSIGVILTSLTLIILIMSGLDPWIAERPAGNMGFSVDENITKFSDLLRPVAFYSIPSFLDKLPYAEEDYSYLGSVWILVVPLLLFIARRIGGFGKMIRQLYDNPLLLSLFIAALVCFFIALGMYMKWDHGSSANKNIFNPFRILNSISDDFKNLRCLNRFIYPSILIFHIMIFKGISYLWKRHNDTIVLKVMVAMVILFYMIDCIDVMRYLRQEFRYQNKYSKPAIEPYIMDSPDTYQGILPIPYFAVGSESDFTHTIDPDDRWIQVCFQTSIANDLPLLAGKLSRTPLRVTKSLQSIFSDSMDLDLVDSLDDRPMLVAVDTTNTWLPIASPEMQKLRADAEQFVEKHRSQLRLVKSVGSVNYYSWDWK